MASLTFTAIQWTKRIRKNVRSLSKSSVQAHVIQSRPNSQKSVEDALPIYGGMPENLAFC
jgi:hypothetical protein